MATFLERVEDVVGTFSDTGAVSAALTAGAARLIDAVKPDKLVELATQVSVPGAGLSLATYRFLAAFRSDTGAAVIPPGREAQATDPGSIFYATEDDPVCIIRDGKVKVYPVGGVASVVAYPTVAHGDSAVTGFKDSWHENIVLYAQSVALRQLINTNATAIGNLSYSAPTAPANPPSPPVITFSDASLGTYTATTIDALGTAPAYTEPTLTINASAPTTLDAPNFSFSAASVSTIADALNTLAAEISTAIGAVATQLTSYQDIELALGYAAEVDRRIQAFQVQSQITLNKAAENARLTTDINKSNAIETLRGQVELYNAKLNRFQQELAKYREDIQRGLQTYQLDIQNKANSFQKELAIYQQDAQHKIEQARLTQQRLMEEANATTNLNLQNEIQTMQALVADYEGTLRLYAEEVQYYGAQVQANVSSFQGNIQKLVAKSAELRAIQAIVDQHYTASLQLIAGA